MTNASSYEMLREVDPSNILAVEAAVQSVREAGVDGMTDMPIYVLSNFTISAIAPFLDFHGLARGLNVRLGFGDYNVIHQPLIQEHSDLYAFAPKILVIALTFDTLDKGIGGDVTARLEDLFALIAANFSGHVIVNTFASSPFIDTASGGADSRSARIEHANDFIRRFVKDNASRFHVCDFQRYVSAIGYEHAIDRRYWYMNKAPLKPAMASMFGADIVKIACATAGMSKKCIVLDCDGTLWGGVLGEEGPDGIKLHPDEYPGNVFYDVQRLLFEASQAGVMLAINSKNNEADVFEVLDNHPHSILKREHFSAMRINWDNKADNLAGLAQELNLGLDSFVFVDDSDFECEMINQRIPAVEVRQVPKRLYEYPDFLSETIGALFAPYGRTQEDGDRAQLYAARRKAQEARASFDDIEGYLRSLEIVVDMHEMVEGEVPRVAQLTGKTNQFNVAKAIYDEDAVRGFLNDDDVGVYVLSVRDKFGDLGLTNVCIAFGVTKDEPIIDTFLMSCRVFERNLEYAFIDFVLEQLRKRSQAKTVRAVFQRSAKNKVAESFYDTVGFAMESDDGAIKRYVLDIERYEAKSFDYIGRV